MTGELPMNTRKRSRCFIVANAAAVLILAAWHREPIPYAQKGRDRAYLEGHICWLGSTCIRAGPTVLARSRGAASQIRAAADQTTTIWKAKEELLAAVESFKNIQQEVGTASVDFGVKGGELNQTSRAPRNLAADGSFYRISEDLGKAADAVLERVDAMARVNPSAEPLECFGTAGGATCPLHGTWSLLFTTAADATFSKNSTRGDAQASNVVDAIAGTVTNRIDFKAGDNGEIPVLEQLRVRLTATAESNMRVALVFRYVQARVTRLFGIPLGGRRLTLTLPVPGPLLTRVLSFFTRKPPPRPYFDILFLDETLRVHRTGEGNVFIQQRVDSAD